MMVEKMDLLMGDRKDVKRVEKQAALMDDNKVAWWAYKMVHVMDKMMDYLKEFGLEARMEAHLEKMTDSLSIAQQVQRKDWKVDQMAAQLVSFLVEKKVFYVVVQMAAMRVVYDRAVLLADAQVASLECGLDELKAAQLVAMMADSELVDWKVALLEKNTVAKKDLKMAVHRAAAKEKWMVVKRVGMSVALTVALKVALKVS